MCHPERSPHPAPRDEAESNSRREQASEPAAEILSAAKEPFRSTRYVLCDAATGNSLDRLSPRILFIPDKRSAEGAKQSNPGRKPWVGEKMISSPGGATRIQNVHESQLIIRGCIRSMTPICDA
jgi:hypothetical protein